MSVEWNIECPDCYELNPSDAIYCVKCGAIIQEELLDTEDDDKSVTVWKVRCPVDGRTFSVLNEHSSCQHCPYECDDTYTFDKSDCKPFCIITEFETPNDEYISSPLLILEEVEAEFDDDDIGHLLNGKYKYIHPPINITNEVLIGRNGDVEQEYFSADSFVSEEHCIISLDDEAWYVEHIGHCNPTCVNENKLSHKIKVKLTDASLLQIADKLFFVTVRGFKNNNELTEVEPKEFEQHSNQHDKCRAEWIITCPCCGWKYIVDDENSSIEECEHCDEFDKEEIAYVRPVKKNVN